MVLFPLPLGAEKIKRKDLSPALSKGEGASLRSEVIL
jgi:hypothetical protein